ncbi:hypothetical protein F5Y08DRAFT_102678 [Xylaria arbuscula]|nr:hypothetical protein F5Y08DRAFT_102678 [Xylaria arbuscula]
MPADEGVEVKQSRLPGAGKGLFARAAFSPGDIVVSVDRPLVTELEVERMLDTCAWCCQRAAADPIERKMAAAMGIPHGFTEVKSCTGCRRVAYCSRGCQTKAWKREHKYECKVISIEDRPPLPPGVRAAIKILGRLKADPDHAFADARKIMSLWPAGDPDSLAEISRLNQKKYEDFQVLGHAAWLYSGKPQAEGLDLQTISRKIVSNTMHNAIPLSSVFDGVPLGIAIDPLISSANHSCDPNAVLVFNQPRHEMRALRKIKAGEEIFLSYIEATNPSHVRQEQLKDCYLFTCKCATCQNGVNVKTDRFFGRFEDMGSEYRKIADKLVSRHELKLSKFLGPGGDDEGAKRVAAIEAEAYDVLETGQAGIDETREVIKLCVGSGLWSWTRQPVPLLCRQLATQYLHASRVYEAFRIGVKLHCEILPALYPQEFYTDRVLNAWSVSTLINVLCGDAHEELYQELAKGGVQLRVLYFGFLFYLHEHTPRAFRPDSSFAKVTDHTYTQIMAGVAYSEEELKEKVQAAWPALEALANNVTVSSF